MLACGLDAAGHKQNSGSEQHGENRHELVQKLAYQHWEKRGSPFGSPEIDWFAAEKAMREYLLASGIELGPDEDLYS